MQRTVLIVDDETDFLVLMTARLRSWGYAVLEATNGPEALTVLKGTPRPDMIILDYMMPEMDGVTALKEIRAIDAKIPVIMFTAYPNVKAIKGAEQLGVSAFIPKMSIYQDTQTSLKSALALLEKQLPSTT